MTNQDSENLTRASLIRAGLQLFGQKGYEGTSTRELARLAGTNIASITYHFGGKAGLRNSCANAVAERLSAAFDRADALAEPVTPQVAGERIERFVGAFVDLIVGTPEARDMVAFMLRELAGSGGSVDVIYAGFIEPRHKTLCTLWATATGRSADDDDVKLAVFALIGQVAYFRIASTFVTRRMSWDKIGPKETRKIAAIVIANVRNAIERHRK